MITYLAWEVWIMSLGSSINIRNSSAEPSHPRHVHLNFMCKETNCYDVLCALIFSSRSIWNGFLHWNNGGDVRQVDNSDINFEPWIVLLVLQYLRRSFIKRKGLDHLLGECKKAWSTVWKWRLTLVYRLFQFLVSPTLSHPPHWLCLREL